MQPNKGASRPIRLPKSGETLFSEIGENKFAFYIMALEAYGDALRECDRMVDALEQYRRAAFKCLCCDDINWADSDYGFILTRPYSGHFYRIFGKCRELLSEDPRLRDTAAAKKLLEYYDDVDAAHQKIRTELDDAHEISKAWGRRP